MPMLSDVVTGPTNEHEFVIAGVICRTLSAPGIKSVEQALRTIAVVRKATVRIVFHLSKLLVVKVS